MTDELAKASPVQAGIKPLLDSLRELIQQARQKVLQAADVVQVQTCWEIGRHIVEYEQGGASRADYGKRLLPNLAETLTAEFGRGFDTTNLRHMRGFFLAFPIRDALRRELGWTNYRTLLRVENEQARQWYLNESVAQGWTTRALERQIGTLYYERLLASSNRAAVEQEAASNSAPLQKSPREFVRDPVMLEFLGISGTGKLLEADLEQALLETCKHSCWNLAKALHLLRDSFASAPSPKISISTWCSTTTCSNALSCLT